MSKYLVHINRDRTLYEKASISVEASNKDEAKKIALEIVDQEDFEIVDSDTHDISVDYVEEVN